MKNYIEHVKLYAKRFLLIVFIYQICRILFYFFNKSAFTSVSLKSFLGGLHFDLSAIAYTNVLFAIFHLIPGSFKNKPTYQRVLKISFFVVNSIFILTNFVDFEYYKFTGRRSSFGMITASGMENEVGGLISSFLVEFWYLPLVAILLLFAFWKCIPSLKTSNESSSNKIQIVKQFGILLLALALSILLGRGGFQKKPIKIVDAVNYGSINQSAIVLNTPFCILTTMGKKEALESQKFYSEEELNSIFSPILELNAEENTLKKNVVIIIL